MRGLSGEIIKRAWHLAPGEGAGMTVVHWARHGENVANVSRTFSYRVFDGDLTDRGIAQARFLAGRLHAAGGRYELITLTAWGHTTPPRPCGEPA